MVRDVLAKIEGLPHLSRFGRRGQAQHGIDGFDALDGNGIVYQATLQSEKLYDKLVADLDAMDERWLGKPSQFVFAVGSRRDAALQREVLGLSDARRSVGRCPVRIVFWDDIAAALMSDGMLHATYFPWVPPQSRIEGLCMLGPDVVFRACFSSVDTSRWRLVVGEMVIGERRDLVSYVASFTSTPVPDRFVVAESLGIGRVLAQAPKLEGDFLDLSVEPSAARENVHATGADLRVVQGDLAIGPDGDLQLVRGLDSAIQQVGFAMSVMQGEVVQYPALGTRCARYFWEERDAETLSSLFTLELARFAFVPRGDGTLLSFIDEVRDLRIASRDDARDGFLPVDAVLVLSGHGVWCGRLGIFIGCERPPPTA